MSMLIVEHAGQRSTFPLTGRVWIGRDEACQIVINHPVVSRRHAYVESNGSETGAIVSDNHSRNGVLIAGQRLTSPRALREGDIFQVGPATFAFHAGDAQAQVVAPSVDEGDVSGIVFACACGARLWAPRGFSGSSTTCPKCGLKVRCPAEEAHAIDTPIIDDRPVDGESAVEVPLLVCAVLASLVGLIAYGLPAAIVLCVSAGYMLVRQGRRRRLLLLASLIALAGMIAGVLFSLDNWMNLSPRELIGR